jgi:hypothetical protein
MAEEVTNVKHGDSRHSHRPASFRQLIVSQLFAGPTHSLPRPPSHATIPIWIKGALDLFIYCFLFLPVVSTLFYSRMWALETYSTAIAIKKDLAIAQTVSPGIPNPAARFRSHVRSCGICDGQYGIGAGFLWHFPLPVLIPISAAYSFIISPTLYSADTDNVFKLQIKNKASKIGLNRYLCNA